MTDKGTPRIREPVKDPSKKSKRISFDFPAIKSNDKGGISKIELLAPKNADDMANADPQESWITIEDKTTLATLSYMKGLLYWLSDLIIDELSRYSKDFRVVSHVLDKKKFIQKTQYKNMDTPNLQDLFDSTLAKDRPTTAAADKGT